MVGAGVSEATGASTGSRGMFSWKGVVGGLLGSSSSTNPALVNGCALKPFFGISKPALVSSPIFSRSRRLKPAAISSRRLSAAICLSFSFLLFLLEMYTMRKLLFLKALFKIESGRVMHLIERVSNLCGLLLFTEQYLSAGVSLFDLELMLHRLGLRQGCRKTMDHREKWRALYSSLR